jgi:hypothetical protein
MKVGKQDLEKGELKLKEYEAAKLIDLIKEKGEIEEKILIAYGEWEREKKLHHDFPALEIRNRIDLLRCEIMNLERKRQEKIQRTYENLYRFLRPFQEEMKRQLCDRYTILEKSKRFVQENTFFDFLGLGGKRIKTNLISILKFQTLISECFLELDKILSLKLLYSKFQETLGSLPEVSDEEIPLTDSLTLLDAEVGIFGNFFQSSLDIQKESWVAGILSPEILKKQISAISDLGNVKKMVHVA